MSTVTPLALSAVVFAWSAGSLVVVGAWCALSLKEARVRLRARSRRARRARSVPPFVV